MDARHAPSAWKCGGITQSPESARRGSAFTAEEKALVVEGNARRLPGL
jgi:hypothetical protein